MRNAAFPGKAGPPSRLRLAFPLVAASATFLATGLADAADRNGDHRIVETRIELEAGAAHFAPWPQAQKTIHAGLGYIEPFGAAHYACGNGFREEAENPVPAGIKAWFSDNAADKNPLFCVYRLQDGDLYAYDVVIGNQFHRPERDEHKDILVNIVIGGTGAYRNASGVWTGATLGRGEHREIQPGTTLPASILKLMDGYVRLPAE
ncbi:MAG: hypothetical protein QM761_10550 [Pseudoxanthomonas sp.]